ncbi:MAG: aminotransferase class I/II-fold pyridoxal phosphate-dependent enzyme [Clostridiales bacterium]|nr:aminotransferase class I/II-fold pyridoxal phosphate-dependent enzyme [Roseburia sp.]MDD7637177.1 aminotransferase class I/II-fold pyridoxal phosphate-dependent enzyme [Clostridiales bacterium]
MQAIILAAGMGKRLGKLTKENTKCMVEVGGVKLVERALRILDKKGLSRIIMVVGYRHENLTAFVDGLGINTPIEYIVNDVYDKTNNIFSLSLAKEQMGQEDTLLLESDLIFEEHLIDLILEDKRETLALVDKFENWMDGTCIMVDDDDNIIDFIPGKLLKYTDKEHYYKTVNIYKLSADFSRNVYVPFLEAYAKVMGNNEYYETVIKLILTLDKNTMKAKRLQGELWYEIDDIQDLDIAELLFLEDDVERYKTLTSRYGGYWRFPHLKDFCYLVNPYFPTDRMMNEIKSNFDVLVRQYPSGMRVNSLLAAKSFAVSEEHIVIGNGAAELIKELLAEMEGTVGVIRPTFEEYPHRCNGEYVTYDCRESDFAYDAESICTYFTEHPIHVLVLINPDNPSGHYLEKKEIRRILDWCKSTGVALILDESFLDFADETNASMLSEHILKKYPNLYLVKSISKSYGVPGLRLGVLASYDEKMIAVLKKKVSIWNINSIGEFFMQILDKYRSDYQQALVQLREERSRFYQELCKIKGIKVYPSSANYFMCELTNGKRSEALAAELLKDNILIKDLTGKIDNGKQYIRIAIRDCADNDELRSAIEKRL